MSTIKDKLLELEEANIIKWSTDRHQYVMVNDPKKDFDLCKFIYENKQHQTKITGECNAKK